MVKVTGYIDIIHDQKSVVTMKDFIAFYHIDEITPEKLFDDNRDNILAAMSLADKYTYMFEHGLTGVLDTLTADKLDPEMALLDSPKYGFITPTFARRTSSTSAT